MVFRLALPPSPWVGYLVKSEIWPHNAPTGQDGHTSFNPTHLQISPHHSLRRSSTFEKKKRQRDGALSHP